MRSSEAPPGSGGLPRHADPRPAALIDPGQARARAVAAVGLLPVERSPLIEAAGLALAEPLIAPFDLPRFANAAMDGNLRLALPNDPENQAITRLALLFVLQSDGFREWLHENVAETVAGFASPMSLAEYEQRLAALEAELAEATREDRKRPLLDQRALVD